MDELISIVQNIWDFICDIIDSMRTFVLMMLDALDSASTLMNIDCLPDPLTTCIIVLFSVGIVKALMSLGGSAV